jgi:F-type H+-transporting ATPase subunit c
MISPHDIHHLSIGLTIVFGGIGGGIGLGLAGLSTIQATTRQPISNESCFKTMLIGLALIESGAIIALVTALILIFGAPEVITLPIALAELGMAITVSSAAATVGIASSFVVRSATQSIARQPFIAQKISTLMLVTQSIIEAPVMFAFIISLLIRMRITSELELAESLKLLASGACMAIGCWGPSVGQAMLASASCRTMGLFKNAYSKIFPFTILCQAVIETPLAFCLLFSLLIIFSPIAPNATSLVTAIMPFVVAAFAMGVGSLGPGIGMGYVASRSACHLASEPSQYSTLLRTTLLAIAFIESSVVYAMVVALLLLRN